MRYDLRGANQADVQRTYAKCSKMQKRILWYFRNFADGWAISDDICQTINEHMPAGEMPYNVRDLRPRLTELKNAGLLERSTHPIGKGRSGKSAHGYRLKTSVNQGRLFQ